MYNKIKLYGLFTVFIFILFYTTLINAATIYLDANLSANCTSGNYSIVNRACAGSDGNSFNNLGDAISNLAGGDTLYIRSGTYIRTTHDLSTGSLSISASGTLGQHTVVSNYSGEQPVICTEAGRCLYNPNPNDTSTPVCNGNSQGGSACYYPNPAISIGGSYIDLIGIKTYGQAYISAAHDVTIQNCDIGGGGPNLNQGAAMMINYNSYNLLIKNNKLHYSVWGENTGYTLQCYASAYTAENNEFYDAHGGDILIKDTKNQQGRTTTIRYNYFRPSSITPTGTSGVRGIAQYPDIDHVYVYNNIFYNKSAGIQNDISPTISAVYYNNTFINCAQDLFNWIDSVPFSAYNNLSYHTMTGQKYYGIVTPNATLNYNMFYSATGDTRWAGQTPSGISINTTSFSTWQSQSGEDANFVNGSNPTFVNPSGSQPTDFKRNSYVENMAGSPYGIHAGAYATGFEIIGLTGGIIANRPSAPSSLR